MPAIIEADATLHKCPFNNFNECFGARCMAWSWTERPYDEVTTSNLKTTEEGERPDGDPPAPEGDGWVAHGEPIPSSYHRRAKDGLPFAKSQTWRRPRLRNEGYCGRLDRW